MASVKSTSDPELAIWERVFVPDPKNITPEQARFFLEVRFPQADLDRINELSAKASAGKITPEENADLDLYVHIGHLLSILKAKVRGRLKETTGSS
jgi:hypothetical protein